MPLYIQDTGKDKLHQKEKPMEYVKLPQFIEPIQDHYTVYILSLANYRSYYMHHFVTVTKALNIRPDAVEDMYDWIIAEALSRTLRIINSTQVINHHKHDLYKCAYDHLGVHAEIALVTQINSNGLRFLENQVVKLLVAGDNLIIAKGTVSHA